jgi:energy-coupling factor transporter ATP-binding protein EcfA2
MKLKRAVIENFKGLKGPLEIDFTSPSLKSPEPVARPLTCLIGDNGSGKTTVLQAIALTLSLATRRIDLPSQFLWHGFQIERVSSLGPTRVELVVSLDDEEIAATRDVYENWYRRHSPDQADPFFMLNLEGSREIRLEYKDGSFAFSSAYRRSEARQMWGRFWIRALEKTQPAVAKYYQKLGDVFWFDQLRNLGSVISGRDGDGDGSASWEVGVERLREYLVGMWGYHTSPKRRDGKDYIELLERRCAELFPGTKFVGIEPRANVPVPRPNDFYFLLERDGKIYDFAEMASGEQAVFPLLFEFVRLDIGKSIVLIDELELHLHPPEQQALLGMLRRIGPDCQFIITTHSPYLEGAIPDEHEVRLEGGRRCL